MKYLLMALMLVGCTTNVKHYSETIDDDTDGCIEWEALQNDEHLLIGEGYGREEEEGILGDGIYSRAYVLCSAELHCG